ncbi:hypothetical protein M408DRAFT_326859 [Serendipita vermifera MAFF 305830]|uniref:Uncharacterized protein n=1 Tax=Serendipita vermifera MAFF 305830 TaxID=933852 RepID=A0A0C3BL96_SERVB|nr:hypothetical protein M408DRAFT_326859 [Serendipita vermifera MAFF 305830]
MDGLSNSLHKCWLQTWAAGNAFMPLNASFFKGALTFKESELFDVQKEKNAPFCHLSTQVTVAGKRSAVISSRFPMT